jgi:hypothetical protein
MFFGGRAGGERHLCQDLTFLSALVNSAPVSIEYVLRAELWRSGAGYNPLALLLVFSC